MKNSLRDYGIVTTAYWSFMLTDGALRMLVLLFFYEQGYSPIQLSVLFLLYEVCGIGTNFIGGWLAVRHGLKATLLAGLALQAGSLLMLSGMSDSWPPLWEIAYVMAAQALSGVAKDLTKMSAKTAVKYLVPAAESGLLFRWVAVLTGSKNAVKGIGFFLGGVLLQGLGFRQGLWLMAGAVSLTLLAAVLLLPREIGQPKRKSVRLAQMFRQGRAINLLSLARVFLFGARDIWFVVAVPVFLRVQLGWEFAEVGAFMATWVIGYGGVQAAAPLVTRRRAGAGSYGRLTAELAFLLVGCIGAMLVGLTAGLSPMVVVLVGLGVFGVLFALTSSVHSYLIVAYAADDRAAMGVGFYYAANAVGRLLGTLLSGILFQAGGLRLCLWGSLLFLVVSTVVSLLLPTAGGCIRTGDRLQSAATE